MSERRGAAVAAETLAINGGPKAKATPYRKGKRFGREELRELREALEQNTLFYAKGKKVRQFTTAFAAKYGMKHCVATSSGTAAIHAAVGAVGVTLGDEVITSVLTDAGTFAGILYQNAVPVFADIDPRTYNMTAETIAPLVTERTKAILVVHLAGGPADMDPIMELARRHKLYVIEDCAQSWNSYYKGRLAGTIGDIGCYSLNDYKHLSAGDAGAILTNDAKLAARAALYADKAYPRDIYGMRTGNVCEFLASNYRMNELEGAVALAQLAKLDTICSRRNHLGDLLSRLISDVPGILPPVVLPDCKSSWWYYTLRIDEDALGVTRDEFSRALAAEGVPASFYLRRVDQYPMFQHHTAYPPITAPGAKVPKDFACPWDCPAYARKFDYRAEACPNVEVMVRTGVIIQMSEFYSDRDIRETAAAVRKVAGWFAGQKG